MEISRKYKVVFTDLDDTLIETITPGGFPKCITDMKIKWDTWNALRDWARGRNDWAVRIVTNQGGIESGYVNEEYWEKKVEYIVAGLKEYLGGKNVDYLYSGTENPDNPFRKPNPGMLKAFWDKDFKNLQKTQAVMLGDSAGRLGDYSDCDKKAAENFGIDFISI